MRIVRIAMPVLPLSSLKCRECIGIQWTAAPTRGISHRCYNRDIKASTLKLSTKSINQISYLLLVTQNAQNFSLYWC